MEERLFMKRIILSLLEICILVSLVSAQELTVPIADLGAGVYKYKASFKIGETLFVLDMKVDISAAADEWTVTETTTAALTGEISDIGVYDKKSLMLINRSFKQGAMSTELAFKQNRVKGKVAISGQVKAFDVEVKGPLFGDGPAFIFSIGALPLAEGYIASFGSFDIETQKFERTQIKVIGSEMVTVPAGLFESYRVEVTSADGNADDYTVWIAKNSRKPVKMITILREMDGVRLTAELQ
jgi:hypothetical protein